MRKALLFGFMFLFLFTGIVPFQAQAQNAFAPFVPGPLFVGTEPELAPFGANATAFAGLPRWLRDPTNGIQLMLCTEQIAGFPATVDPDTGAVIPPEAPPCPGLSTVPVDPLVSPIVGLGASYYMASVVMCDDPLECDQTPGAVPPGTPRSDIYILELLVGAEPADPAAPEPPEPPGFGIRLRGPGGNDISDPGPYTIESPFGTFGPLDVDPARGEVRPLPQTVAADLLTFRGNGTANFPVPNVNPDPEAVPPLPLVNVPAFPNFLGNGLLSDGVNVLTAPLLGPGGSTFRVTTTTRTVDVQTNKVLVEGKAFTTPTATGGGLIVERGTMGSGARAKGALFATTNVGTGIQITQVGGVAQTIAMTPDPNNAGRFFATFPMGNLGGAVEAGVSMTATGVADPAVATEVQDIAHIMQDTLTLRTATFRNGRLSINITSSLPGNARTAPGATLRFESVPSMDPAALGTPIVGTANRGRFTAELATAPTFVRAKSSLGGMLTFPVRTTPAGAQEIITIRRATFNSTRGTLQIQASSSDRAATATLTARGVSISPAGVITPLGDIVLTRGRATVNTVAPPPWVEVSSAGAVMRVPVTIQ